VFYNLKWIGRLENWKIGKLEDWNNGIMENWKINFKKFQY